MPILIMALKYRTLSCLSSRQRAFLSRCTAVRYVLNAGWFWQPPSKGRGQGAGRSSGNQNVLFQFTYFKMRESVERVEGEGEGRDVNGTFSLQIARFISYLQRMK